MFTHIGCVAPSLPDTARHPAINTSSTTTRAGSVVHLANAVISRAERCYWSCHTGGPPLVQDAGVHVTGAVAGWRRQRAGLPGHGRGRVGRRRAAHRHAAGWVGSGRTPAAVLSCTGASSAVHGTAAQQPLVHGCQAGKGSSLLGLDVLAAYAQGHFRSTTRRTRTPTARRRTRRCGPSRPRAPGPRSPTSRRPCRRYMVCHLPLHIRLLPVRAGSGHRTTSRCLTVSLQCAFSSPCAAAAAVTKGAGSPGPHSRTQRGGAHHHPRDRGAPLVLMFAPLVRSLQLCTITWTFGGGASCSIAGPAARLGALLVSAHQASMHSASEPHAVPAGPQVSEVAAIAVRERGAGAQGGPGQSGAVRQQPLHQHGAQPGAVGLGSHRETCHQCA
jgi:hypothetical protein